MLIVNATVANWTPRQIEPNQAILVRDGRIADVGLSFALTARYPDEKRYDAQGRLVFPGNICAHTHFYGTFARGMAIPGRPPRNFPEILEKLWWPLDKALTLEDVKLSTQLSALNAIQYGTTTLIDHHASPNAIDGSLDVIADVIEETGLRAVLCYEVTDRDGEAKAKAGIAENVRFLRSMASGKRKNLAATFGLHASLTLSEETLRASRQANSEFGGGFHIHVAEHEADVEDSLERSGLRTVRRLQHNGILGPRTIAAHAVHVDPWELELLRETETWVSHQPRSNMNNGVGAAHFDDMVRGGIKVCLGTDGFVHDMFAEWKAAYFLHKVANRDPRRANGNDIVQVAVEHNSGLAEMFFPGQMFGSLTVGSTADLMVVDYKPFTPLTPDNLPWHILFGFETAMVTGTIVAGKPLMWDRELLTIDEEKVIAEALKRAPEVWARYTQFATR